MMANFAPGLLTSGTPRIPVTLYDIKLGGCVSAYKERDGFVKPSQVIQEHK